MPILLSSLFLGLSLLTTNAFAGSFDGRYVVSEEDLNLLPSEMKPATILSHKGLHLVKLNEKQVKTLKHHVHEKKHTCGGLMAVETDLQRTSPQALLEQLASPQVARTDVQSAPQFASAVEFVISKTVKNRYEATLKSLGV